LPHPFPLDAIRKERLLPFVDFVDFSMT